MLNHSRMGAVFAAFLLSGCANLASINRTTQIPPVPAGAESPAFAGGTAIHLDASQRLFYQANGHFCAEPMPDALQSLASSSGVGAAAGEKVSAAVSTAFSTNAASIGLHTQSTTLMRDQYYRICELAANTNMSAPQVAQLMERAQRYTLGILAVEQLTGAVVAQQAAVSSSADSSAVAVLGATADALDKAQAALADKKAVASAAASEASAADAQAAASAQGVADAGDGATDAQKAQAAADKAAASDADGQAAAASANQKLAQKTVDIMLKSVGSAQASANSAARGSATLGASATHSNVSSSTVKAIADATDSIVGKLLERGDIVDSCMAMMMDSNAEAFFARRPTLLASCQLAIETSVKVAQANGHSALRMMMTLDPDAAKTLKLLTDPEQPAAARKKK